MEHEIVVRDNEPVWRPNFRIPDADLDFVKNAAKEWLRLGLIRPSRSNYNAALFCVRKKDGSLRVVLDYRALNQKTLPAKYLLRTVDECIAEIGRLKSKVFSMLDLTSGFWQVPLKEEHRHLSAFTRRPAAVRVERDADGSHLFTLAIRAPHGLDHGPAPQRPLLH